MTRRRVRKQIKFLWRRYQGLLLRIYFGNISGLDKFLYINSAILSIRQKKFIILIILDMSYKSIFKTFQSFLFYFRIVICSSVIECKHRNFSFLVCYNDFFHKFVIFKYNNLLIYRMDGAKYCLNRSIGHIVQTYVLSDDY